MLKNGLALLLIAAAAMVPGTSRAAAPVFSGPDAQAWVKGQILVMPRAGLPAQALARILAAHGGKAKKIGQSNIYIVKLPANASEKAVVAQLSHNPHLKFAELDRRVASSFVPNDPYYGSQWHLQKIGAALAWDNSHGEGVTIAILDSGVESAHPDLMPKLVAGWNFYENNANTADARGHGTKVAGTAAALGNNATGVSGVAGQAKIMPLRVSDANGYTSYSLITQALTWAADQGAKVANASFSSMAASASIINAAQYMRSKGGLVVVSAGNNGIDENITPTTALIAVSATNSMDAKTSWSSYGNFVTLAAPGEGIWTTQLGGGYGSVSGTSFSSPMTAGVIALMMAANPSLSNTKIEELLIATAVDLGAAGRDLYYGYGRIHAAAAVQAAYAAVPAVDTQAPLVSITSPSAGATVAGIATVNLAASDNVGVARVELQVNGTTVAIDTSAPFGFSWDTTGAPNGMANLVVHAVDAAGNNASSAPVSVNVANETVAPIADTTPPVVNILNPVAGTVKGNVTVSINATDNSGAAGISHALFIDGVRKATGTGATLSYNWNSRKAAVGPHTIQAVAKDAAGNESSASVKVDVK